MKLFWILLLATGTAFGQSSNDSIAPKGEINWLTFEEAVELNAQNPKKMFIDVYTDWCGWCKRMDATTFSNKEVADYMNEHFYAVKLDAEQRDSIVYKGTVFKYDPSASRRGSHELAAALLDGKMSYPSYVYLSKEEQKLTISPGYKESGPFLLEIQYIAENHFEEMTFQEFKAKMEVQN